MSYCYEVKVPVTYNVILRIEALNVPQAIGEACEYMPKFIKTITPEDEPYEIDYEGLSIKRIGRNAPLRPGECVHNLYCDGAHTED